MCFSISSQAYPHKMRVTAVLTLFLSLFLSTRSQTATKIPNVDFLGSGYDIFIGNPYNKLFDPGFRGEVLALTYNQVNMNPGEFTAKGRHDYTFQRIHAFCLFRSKKISHSGSNEAPRDVNTTLHGSTYPGWNMFHFSLLMKTEQARSATSAATSKVTKPHYWFLWGLNYQPLKVVVSVMRELFCVNSRQWYKRFTGQ